MRTVPLELPCFSKFLLFSTIWARADGNVAVCYRQKKFRKYVLAAGFRLKNGVTVVGGDDDDDDDDEPGPASPEGKRGAGKGTKDPDGGKRLKVKAEDDEEDADGDGQLEE